MKILSTYSFIPFFSPHYFPLSVAIFPPVYNLIGTFKETLMHIHLYIFFFHVERKKKIGILSSGTWLLLKKKRELKPGLLFLYQRTEKSFRTLCKLSSELPFPVLFRVKFTTTSVFFLWIFFTQLSHVLHTTPSISSSSCYRILPTHLTTLKKHNSCCKLEKNKFNITRCTAILAGSY